MEKVGLAHETLSLVLRFPGEIQSRAPGLREQGSQDKEAPPSSPSRQPGHCSVTGSWLPPYPMEVCDQLLPPPLT